mgnify:CR=1 FL=1
MKDKNSNVFRTTRAVEDLDIYVTGYIDAPEWYLEELQALKEATEGSNCSLFINSGGGNVSTAAQFLAKLTNTKARVTSHIEGSCHSAATLLFLAADSWVVGQDATMLIHNYSGGAFGKGNEILEHAEANKAWIHTLMDRVYTGFLTKEELTSVKENRDIWLNQEQILARLDNLIAHRAELAATAEHELQGSLKEQMEEYIRGDSEKHNS